MLSKLHFFFYLYFYWILSKLIFLVKRKVTKSKKSILYFSAFFPDNAGYHWRVKKWAEELEKEGYTVDIVCGVNKEEFYVLLKENHTKFLRLYLKRRFWQVVNSRKYETVIVRRELLLFNDYGNLFLEKLLLKVHPNAILDFDDDIAAAKNQPKQITNTYACLLKEHGNKFNESLRLYKRFIVVSNYLKEKVLIENKNIKEEDILIIPTCVDYDKHPPKQYPSKVNKLAFGWIGGDHNYYLIDILIPTLNELAQRFEFKLIVIGGEEFKRETDFDIEFIPWSLNTEVENLHKIDVGLMPLEEDLISRGKGGFKLIQYMGLGIVSVASAITINCEIIDNEKSSFLVDLDKDWMPILIKLLDGEIDLQRVGQAAREKIIAEYTFEANSEKYIEFLRK